MDCNASAEIMTILGQLGLLVVITVFHYVRQQATKSLKRDLGREFDELLDRKMSSEYRDQRPTPPPYNRI